MSLLTPEPGLLFWMLLSFGFVLFVLGKYGFPIIVKMVDKRKAYIDESLEAAKEARVQLAGVKQESERMLNEVREEQVRILKEAREIHAKIVGDAKVQAAQEAAKITNEAQAAIQKEKEKALRDVRNQIADLSLDIAEKVLRKNLEDKPAQQSMVERLIEEVQQN